MRKLLGALLLFALAWSAQAGVQTFERAELISPMPGGSPNDQSEWTQVSLPHNWWYHTPRIYNYGWYRVRINIAGDPAHLPEQSLYLPRTRLNNLSVYINGQRIWTLIDAYAEGVAVPALRLPIPLALLQRGENTIDLEARGVARWFHGMSRIYVGDTRTLAKVAALRTLLQDRIVFVVAAAFGSIGLLSLWLWYRAGRDPVLFWYGVSGVTLLAATVAWYLTLWQSQGDWRMGTLFMRYHGYLVPFFILHLRLVGRKHYLLEAGLWLALFAAFSNVTNLFGVYPHLNANAWAGWGLAFSVLPALLIIPLLASPTLRKKPTVMLLVVADLAACLLPLHDWAFRFGIIDFDRPILVFFAPAFVMLAAMAPILERMREGLHAKEQNRQELERRVAEKTREIESSHEQLRRVLREQTLAEERRRIMADMHDGLGARLVSLLSVAQSGKATRAEISEGISAALDELRLTVDSALPVEGDVSVVLGRVRHRMRSVFERAGVQLNWNVSELPHIEDLTPERILAIQRIFLEAFSNAIRHSGAQTVSVFTLRVPGAVRVVIEDDGRGFDTATGNAGTGLANLQLRASQAGGNLVCESQPGRGTRIVLSLPLATPLSTETLPNSGQESDNYPLLGMSTERAEA